METIITVANGLIPLLILALVVRAIVRRLRGHRGIFDRNANIRGRGGEEIEKTRLAKLGLGGLDTNAAIIATAGTARAAPMSLDDHILRPSIGLRAMSVIGSGAALVLTWFGHEDWVPLGDMAKMGLTAALAYGALIMFTYELRYNRDRLIARGWLFNRREFAWRDLVRIRDNGHYLYVLNFSNGARLEIQKHLVGMPDFLSRAKQQIATNLRGESATRETIRPGGSLFGSRKTFS